VPLQGVNLLAICLRQGGSAQIRDKLVHIAGAKNGRVDALSRHPNYNQGEEDNKKLVVIPEGFFQRAYGHLAGSDEANPSEAHSWQ
jgi:hypothetical protein